MITVIKFMSERMGLFWVIHWYHRIRSRYPQGEFLEIAPAHYYYTYTTEGILWERRRASQFRDWTSSTRRRFKRIHLGTKFTKFSEVGNLRFPNEMVGYNHTYMLW